jgi:hypothetical protein
MTNRAIWLMPILTCEAKRKKYQNRLNSQLFDYSSVNQRGGDQCPSKARWSGIVQWLRRGKRFALGKDGGCGQRNHSSIQNPSQRRRIVQGSGVQAGAATVVWQSLMAVQTSCVGSASNSPMSPGEAPYYRVCGGRKSSHEKLGCIISERVFKPKRMYWPT